MCACKINIYVFAYNIFMKKLILILLSIVCILVVFLFVIFNFVLYPVKFDNYVNKYSKEYSLEPALVYAVIKTESSFNDKAKSSAGAMGLMQIMPSTAKFIAEDLGLENYNNDQLFEPETNIQFGCYYLRYLFDKFKDIEVVICAYNAGEGAVKSWLDDNGKLIKDKINFSETKNYYNKVLINYNAYKNQLSI